MPYVQLGCAEQLYSAGDHTDQTPCMFDLLYHSTLGLRVIQKKVAYMEFDPAEGMAE